MPINAPTVWRIRPGGSTLNGAGYDSTSYPGGVDYTQQDAAQLTLTDLVGNGTTTLTSSTGGFTSQMVGNAINITAGTGATVGFYFISSVASSNSVTIDRSPGTFTGGTGRVGGGWGGSTTNPFSISGPVAGNTVFVRGSGSDTPGSADYTFTGHSTLNSGNATAGRVRFIGENGRPRLHGNGLILFNVTWMELRNLYLFATSNINASTNGMIHVANSNVVNVVLNMNNQTGIVGFVLNGSCNVDGCDIWSGVTSPTFSSGVNGINTANTNTITNTVVRNMRGIGINARSGDTIRNCWVYGCAGDGVAINTPTNTSFAGGCIDSNTIHGNAGHGITHSGGTAFTTPVRNNLLTGHTTAARFGLNVSSGTSAVVAALRSSMCGNFFHNNTGHRSANLAADSTDVDLTADPYTNAASADFTLNSAAGGGAAVRGLGSPVAIGTYPQSTGPTRMTYPDGGASQHQDAGGGGSGVSGARIFTGF